MKTEKELQATLLKECPFGTGLKVGDIVTFTNEYGVSFPNQKILGFDSEKWNNRYVFLEKDAYWFPVPAESLTKNVGGK